MKLGFDVDGVLANFVRAYQLLTVRMADGVNLFEDGDILNPPCWNWPEHRGYAPELMKKVWAHVIDSKDFWQKLEPLSDAKTLAMCMPDLEDRHDIYFITSRPSNFNAKLQTERWLRQWIGVLNPTVLISSDKGLCCSALKLDAYIDDYGVNIEGCVSARLSQIEQAKAKGVEPKPTTVFLLERNYNREVPNSEHIIKVKTVGQMLDYLVLDL